MVGVRDAEASPVAVVIFGAAVRCDGQPSNTLRLRVEAAIRFGARLPGTIYVPTGAVGRFGPSEASVMTQLLQASAVPRQQILPEETGTDTVSSILAVVSLLRARGHAGPVYAATSAYHLPRCVLLMRLAGLLAQACPPPTVAAARSFGKRWYWRLREVPALPWDAGIMLLARLRGRV
jgi:uncharacterized SAM-binding protein YcdF (DUF218 family)